MPFLIPILASVGGLVGGGAATGAAILGGGAASIAGSALASGSKTTTTTPIQSPAIASQQDNLLAILDGMAADPTGGLAPQRNADSGQINQAYATMPNTVTQMLASRGFGSSGKVGDAVYNTEGARLGAQSDLYGKYAALGSQRQLSATQIIQSILQNNTGKAVTTPGNGLAAALMSGGNALTNLVSLHTIMQLMNGGGSGGSGGSASIPSGYPAPTPPDPATQLPSGLINRTGNTIDGVPSLPVSSVPAPTGTNPTTGNPSLLLDNGFGSSSLLSPDPSGGGWG